MNLDLWFYWRLFIRRLPVMALFVLLCGGLSVVFALRLPDTYSASAQLLVESPQIPEGMATPVASTDTIEQLEVIEQRLLTRANLIDIANSHNVFLDRSEMTPDEVVEEMRNATSIRRSFGRDQATLMTISFEARSGQIAATVVNDYVTRVLQESTSNRRARVQGTLDFFEQEVARLSGDLDAQSARIVQFKSENAAALPEDQSYRLNRQTLLQERLARLEQDRAAAEDQRQRVIRVFEATGRITGPGAGLAEQQTPEQARLAALKLELREALTVYSETNPRVVGLQARIDQLEETVAAQQAAAIDPSVMEDGAAPAESTEDTVLQLTLSEIESRLETLNQEIDNTQTELQRLSEAISASSTNAIILDGLQREYDNIEGRYARAVANLNQAQLGERIEATSQGERIAVLEGPSVPDEPTGPNRPKIVILGVGAGLGLAGGFFALLELLNRTIRRPVELESRFGVTPIATIPYMESRGRRWLRRSGTITALLLVLAGVPALLWWIDTHYMPLQLVVQKILDRMNLG